MLVVFRNRHLLMLVNTSCILLVDRRDAADLLIVVY